MFSYIVQGDKIICLVNGQQHVVNKAHVNYDKIVAALKEERYEDVADLVDLNKSLAVFADGRVEIRNDTVLFDGQPLHGSIVKRMLDMYRGGFPVTPLVNFLLLVKQNPSARAVNGLFDFLDRNNLPLTPDGHVLAFKRVNKDFTDCYTSKINNSVGQVVSTDRNNVDDDFNRTCSFGLHICSMEYLTSSGYGGADNPIVICKVSPADVVAFPNDYNHSKARVCRYEVVALHEAGEKKADWGVPVVNVKSEPKDPPAADSTAPAAE